MALPKFDFILGPAILIYLATIITELVSSVPVGLVQNNFEGNCILSSTVTFFPKNDSIKVEQFGSKTLCEFCTYLTIFTTLFPLLYGGYSLYALCQTLDNATQMWVLPALMLNSLLMVLKFISSCILSVGISQLCSSITRDNSLKSCKDGQAKNWFTEVDKLNGKHYYNYLITSQTASWICVLEWIALLVLSILHYRRNIILRSGGSSSPLDVNADTAGVVVNEVVPQDVDFNPLTT